MVRFGVRPGSKSQFCQSVLCEHKNLVSLSGPAYVIYNMQDVKSTKQYKVLSEYSFRCADQTSKINGDRSKVGSGRNNQKKASVKSKVRNTESISPKMTPQHDVIRVWFYYTPHSSSVSRLRIQFSMYFRSRTFHLPSVAHNQSAFRVWCKQEEPIHQ